MEQRTFELFDYETKSKLIVEAKKSGVEWKTNCPKHEDGNPSLSINEEKGKFNCFGCGFNGSLYDPSKDSNNKKEIETVYDYQDKDGNLLFQVVRYNPKDFRQRRPDGNGGYIWNLEGIQTVLYELPEIIKSDEVIIVEGEKDADNLLSLGFCATTAPMGAGKWREHYNEYLKDKDVILIPDNDPAGMDHMKQVANSVNGTKRSLKLIQLPEHDVSDWSETFEDKNEAAERLAIMIENAEPYILSHNPKEPIKFCDVSFTPREHIIKDFPLDRKLLYVHSAEGGGLKSFIALHLIKCILARLPLFGKYEILLSGPVFLFDEETPEPIMEERLNGFGLKNKDYEGYLFHFSGLKIDRDEDLRTILSMVEKYHPVLCVFDSFTRFHNGEENSNTEMKEVMMNFRQIANMGPMTWIIHHVAKESKLTRGASEIPNAADLEFCNSIDKEGLVTLKTGKVRIEQPEPIILKPIFSPRMDVVYQMTQGALLWDQIKAVMEAKGELITVGDIEKQLEKEGIANVTEKMIRSTLEGKVKAGLATSEKLPVQITGKGGSVYEKKVRHYGI